MWLICVYWSWCCLCDRVGVVYALVCLMSSIRLVFCAFLKL